MGAFDVLGVRPRDATGPDHGARPGMASFARLELIRIIWAEYTDGEASAEASNTRLDRVFNVSSLRVLTVEDARKGITALKAIKARCRAA